MFVPVGYSHSIERPFRDCKVKMYLCLFNTSIVVYVVATPIAQWGAYFAIMV